MQSLTPVAALGDEIPIQNPDPDPTLQATDIYKRVLLEENRDFLALNVYVALCYYKLDYYDVSLEILAAYLQSHPDSSIALNLKACNQFRLYDGKAAEAELAPLTKEALTVEKIDSKLVRHNMVSTYFGMQSRMLHAITTARRWSSPL